MSGGITQKKAIEDFSLKTLSLVEINRVLLRLGALVSQAHGVGQNADLHGSRIVNLGTATRGTDAINKQTLDDELEDKIDKPVSSTDNAIARFDGTEGNLQNSLATVDDAGSINIPAAQTYKVGGSPHAHALDDLSDVALTGVERGDLLFRGASGWENINHGTDGQVLTTKGHGANPEWADASGGLEKLSVADVDSPTELSGLSGMSAGDTVLVYDSTGEFTVYCYNSGVADNSPYALGGWVAVAGRYSNLSLQTDQMLVNDQPTNDYHVMRKVDMVTYWPSGYWPTGYWP